MVGLSGTSHARWIIYAVPPPVAVSDSVALASNNGWSVTRRQTGRIHVVYSDRPQNEKRHVYHRMFDFTNGWKDPWMVSDPDIYACEGVVASRNLPWFDTLAFAYCSAPNGQTDIPTRVMCAVCYLNGANNNQGTWPGPVELPTGVRQWWFHYLVRNPSIVMVHEGREGEGPHAVVTWADSCEMIHDEDYLPLGWYIFYGLVDVADGNPPSPNHHAWSSLVEEQANGALQADFPSIAWDQCGVGSNAEDFFVAHQRLPNPSLRMRVFAGFRTATGGYYGAQASQGNGVDSFPSIQVIAPYTGSLPDHDSILVAFTRHTGSGPSRIWKVLAYRDDDDEIVPYPTTETQVLPNWYPTGGRMRTPNLWCSGDNLAMVYHSNAPLTPNFPDATYVTVSNDATRQHNSNTWIPPIRLPGINHDQASVYGDAVELDVVYRQMSSATAGWPMVRLCVLRDVSWVTVPPSAVNDNVSRGLQQLDECCGYLHRIFIADSTVCMDLSTDNGATWVSAGSPGWGEKPALALDSDSILCAAYVEGCTLFCNWWYPYWYDWVSQETVYVGAEGEVIGQPSVALYPGKSDGVKVAALSWVVYDEQGNESRVMFAKCDTGRVVLDTVEVAANLADSFPCINIANSDSVVSSELKDYGPGNWSRPAAWSSLKLVTARGRGPMSVLEGDVLHCVWVQRVAGQSTDTFNICHSTCDLSPTSMFQDWVLGANPSSGTTGTTEKANSVYAGCGVTVWQEQVSGVWNIYARVRDSIVTLASCPDTSLASPHALAESSSVSPSIDQVRVKL